MVVIAVNECKFKYWINYQLYMAKEKEKKFVPYLTPDQKAMIDTAREALKGKKSTNDLKQYKKRRSKYHKDKALGEIAESVRHSKEYLVVGVILGSLFSIFGGLFASAYIKWLETKDWDWGGFTSAFAIIVIGLFFTTIWIVKKLK